MHFDEDDSQSLSPPARSSQRFSVLQRIPPPPRKSIPAMDFRNPGRRALLQELLCKMQQGDSVGHPVSQGAENTPPPSPNSSDNSDFEDDAVSVPFVATAAGSKKSNAAVSSRLISKVETSPANEEMVGNPPPMENKKPLEEFMLELLAGSQILEEIQMVERDGQKKKFNNKVHLFRLQGYTKQYVSLTELEVINALMQGSKEHGIEPYPINQSVRLGPIIHKAIIKAGYDFQQMLILCMQLMDHANSQKHQLRYSENLIEQKCHALDVLFNYLRQQECHYQQAAVTCLR